MTHPYGDDWFSCDSCGGDFERFNQVEARGRCEGCATLAGLTDQDRFLDPLTSEERRALEIARRRVGEGRIETEG